MLIIFAVWAGSREIPVEDGNESTYKGIIRLYDYATPTVLGNDFSVISTVCEEFSEKSGYFLRLERISGVTLHESYGYAVESADIIRYDESLDGKAIMQDENGEVVVPVWYDIGVIIVNTDVYEAVDTGFDEFADFCSELYEEGECVRYDSEKILKIFTDPSYSSDMDPAYFTEDPDGITSFFSGDTAVFAGTLKDVAYLVRQEKLGKEVPEYSFFPIPAREDVVYVTDIASYAALRCEDEKKAVAVKEFMEHLSSYEAVRYTENLGMLPFYHGEEIAYEKYPYLRELADLSGERVVVR